MSKGIITSYVLVFGAIFLLLLSGLFGFILLQLRQSNQKVAWNESFQIAEAGINYYRWCLNNEVELNCQAEKDYHDLIGNSIGHFSLNIAPTIFCGQTIQREITSTGWQNKFPDIKRKIRVLYARESVAKYSYILNDNVWVGQDHIVRGPFHSNGGIRFDGRNLSTVSSVQEEWVCTSSFGCGPQGLPGRGVGLGNCPLDQCQVINQQCVCPGVFTNTYNPNEDLFSFPLPPFDFNAITIDLAQMKAIAQSSGIYLPPSKNINSQGRGWHLIFNEDRTVTARIITNLNSTRAYSLEEGWHYDYFTIAQESFYQTFNIPSGCPAIFVEDNLWPEGKIKEKMAVASANLIDPNLDTDVVLENNIDYTLEDGSDGLTLIGQRNVLIGPDSPNQMILRGIFVAQKGHFSRNHYPGNVREKLEIYGSIISNGRVGTQWVSGSQVVSGYLNRETYLDPYLISSPPPFTPYISSNFKLFDWEEIR